MVDQVELSGLEPLTSDTKQGPPPGARQRTLARDAGEGSREALYARREGGPGVQQNQVAAAP